MSQHKYRQINNTKVLIAFLVFFLMTINSLALNNPLNLRRSCKAANDSDIVLKWTIPNDVCNSFRAYYIYGRKDAFSAFGLIDSVTILNQAQYDHKGAFLLANTWQYFVVLHTDCSGQPTQSSDTLSIDLTQTNNQYIDSVSTDPVTGKYIIGWKINTSPDLAGYKIYTISGANNLVLTDVDNTTNFFTDNTSSPSTATKNYTIAAYDSCNNITAILDKHTPILLSVSFDSCSHAFDFSWSGYIGFPLLKYEIMASINGNPFFKIKDITNVNGILKSTIVDTAFHDGDNACFYVRVINSSNTSISSSSNRVCLIAKFISLASVNYIADVKVIDNSTVNIRWITNQYTFISSVHFQQSTDGLSFKTIEVLNPILDSYTFVVDSLSTSTTKYFFRTIIYNTCNQAQDTCLVCNSILLQAKKVNITSNRINWSEYLIFDASVEKYEIYQGTGDPIIGHSYTLLTTVIPDSLGYSDMMFPADILNDGVCYYVLAYEKAGNTFGIINGVSKSNEVCVPGELVVFFPNAFNPNSHLETNSNFKPKGLYINYQKSWIKIYNRWGQLVYESDNLLKGWDGTDSDGNILPSEQYVYLAHIASLKNNGQNLKGIVNLIR